MHTYTFTAYVEYDPEAKLYVGTVPSLPGAHSQGVSLDELHKNLEEVIALCLEEQQAHNEIIESDHFVGIQRIAVSA
jgi:predicted RNase H-like HicB family nuclease